MRARLFAAFAAVYLVWGSTYLAIRFAVETLPPFLMAGSRFVLSGLLLMAWARWKDGAAAPSRVEWRIGIISGALLLLGGNGAVAWAEQRVPSGIAALLVAIVPLWMVLLEWMRPGGRRPAFAVFAGVTLGLAGLLLLVGPDSLRGGADANSFGALVLVLASLSWAAGSLYTKWAPTTSSSTVRAATQMLAGGVLLILAGVVFGEPARLDLAHVSMRSLLGFAYLVTFGSLIGFTAYLYLLAHTTAAKAATYAYVNPVVAVLLGWAIGHEAVTARTILAAAVILAGVAIITIARDDSSTTPATDVGEAEGVARAQ
ncbi:MAG: EamA family transporter [Gemmatimonadaceae bacterium]